MLNDICTAALLIILEAHTDAPLDNDCGYAGNKAQDITIDYDLKLALKIIGAITVTPSFSASASFPCPDQLSRSLLDNVRKGTAA